jgi:hypothetical protein
MATHDRSFGYIADPTPRMSAFKKASSLALPYSTGDAGLLLAWCPPVQDQGRESSCTGQAAKALCDIAIRKRGGKEQTSALFPYANGRALEWGKDAIGLDMGAYICRVLESLTVMGNVPYDEWGDNAEATETPPAMLYEDGYTRRAKASDWVRVLDFGEDKLRGVEHLISNGLPVCFGGPVSDAYCNYRGGGGPVDPAAGTIVGMHAQTIVGYDRPNRLALLRNSWGESFGGNSGIIEAPRGYAWIPYSYLLRGDVTDFSAIADFVV